MARVRFVGLGKKFDDGTDAVRDLSLDIADGEFMVMVGPSGCGKTTALRMCAGLEDISEGKIYIGDNLVNDWRPSKRDIAVVFQNYALYPSMSVYDNIAFPLRSRGASRAVVREKVEKVASMLALEPLLKRKPGQLSGGQSQRVAMGRALIREPQVFLMDEPLSNLDAKLRVQMRSEITSLQRSLGVTTIYVTHDQVEAMTMGTRIAVMRKGVLQQVGKPQEIYDRPVNLFVASFMGSPPMNLVSAQITRRAEGVSVAVGSSRFDLDADVLHAAPALADFDGREVFLGVRPERVMLGSGPGQGPGARIHANVKLVEALGYESLVHLEIDADPTMSDELLEIARDIDAAATTDLVEGAGTHHAHVVARSTMDHGLTEGSRIELVVPQNAMYFFDPATGESLRANDVGFHRTNDVQVSEPALAIRER